MRTQKNDLDRENSIVDSESDASDFFKSPEIAKSCTPPTTHHVIQYEAPNYDDTNNYKNTNTLGSKQASKDARRAVKKRREAQKGCTKDNTSISCRSTKNKSKLFTS